MIHDKNNYIENRRTFYLFENKKSNPKKDSKHKN